MKNTIQKTTHKKAMIEALTKSLGIVTTACKAINIERSTFYDWYNTDEDFKKQVDEIGNVALDFAESKLHKKIESGDTTAIIFYLKTKGKNRGYIETRDVSLQINEEKQRIANLFPTLEELHYDESEGN